jgi:hypothetical protein
MRWWPFGSKAKMASIDPVVLTEEEQNECQAMLRSLTKAEGGEYVMREDLIPSFKRSIIALCMMGRAERFLILANSQPEYKEEACRAAAKACAVFPLSIYFYDFGCVLDEVGKTSEAKQMFAEFLRRCGTETLDAIMQTTLNQRDVEAAVRRARETVSRV